MKTNIKLWTMGLMTAALLGNTACTDLLHESYGQVVSEDYVPKTEEDVSYLVNAIFYRYNRLPIQYHHGQEEHLDPHIIPVHEPLRSIAATFHAKVYKRHLPDN